MDIDRYGDDRVMILQPLDIEKLQILYTLVEGQVPKSCVFAAGALQANKGQVQQMLQNAWFQDWGFQPGRFTCYI